MHFTQGPRWALLLCLLAFWAARPLNAASFHLGNSLTFDTSPQLLPDSDYSIFCGRSLDYIVDNPDGFCIESSTEWTDALVNNSYDTVVVQPYLGDTLESAIEDISNFMALQPDARFIIHTGWAGHEDLLSDYASETALHSPAFFEALAAGLPRSTTSTFAVDALVYIANDPNSPYTDISDLYRDDLHLTLGDGRYFAHNLLRRAMGLPYETPSNGAPLDHKEYLDSLLALNDFDWDGDTDGADFLNWQRAYTSGDSFDWTRGASSVSSLVVPEPAAGLLLGVALLLLLSGELGFRPCLRAR